MIDETTMMQARLSVREELIALAKAKEPEVLARADDLFATFAEEHERQTRGYSFDCRRWGDFLSVFIERAGNRPSHEGGTAATKLSTTLNIASTRQIRPVDGRCFDRRGTVSYSPWVASDDSGRGRWWHDGIEMQRRTPAERYVVEAHFEKAPPSRPMTGPGKISEDHYGFGRTVGYVTPNFPRPAKDDEINFVGIKTTIYAPAGLGACVLASILAEIERGHTASAALK